MGKDLKGKEIGEGVYQLQSGKYCARVAGFGKRISKTFDRLVEAKIWVAERQARTSTKLFDEAMTLDEWFNYWIEDIKRPAVKYSTYESYRDIYTNRIKDKMGYMRLQNIRAIDCQKLLNDELKINKHSTVKHTLMCLQQLFNSAVDGELIDHSPVEKIRIRGGEKKERRVLTAEEQRKLVEYVTSHNLKHSDEWLFILETGLRIGELLGLKWSDVEDRKIYVRRQMYYVREDRHYIETTPKTQSGMRMIPLTKKAYSILKNRKVTRLDYIFLDPKTETRVDSTRALWHVCDKIGIERISVHGLRHSFATRCIEAGMRPKTLQKILGHSTLAMTMDLYVHVTDDTLEEEMKKLEGVI